MGHKDDCAVRTSTCHDMNINIPGGLLSSTRHDNLDFPGFAELNQEVRVAVKWLNREINQVSAVNTLYF